MQTKAIRRVAAIDIGTNSVRLARGVMNDGRFCMEQKDLETTRIGEGTTTTDRLSDEPMRRTADAVAFFARQAADSGYALLGVYATSAVREAPNKDEFLALCRARGVEVEVLSGHAESAVAYYGAAQGKAGVCAVADIGGGSTELSFGRDGRLEFGQSARVGAVRMRELFAKEDGSLDDAAYDALLAHVKSALLPIAEKIPKGAALIGVGGTFTSLAAMQQRLTVYDPARVQDFSLRADDIESFSRTLCRMSMEQRLALPGLKKKRADIMPCAAVIARAVMETVDADAICVSERDGLEGYAQAKAIGILERLIG